MATGVELLRLKNFVFVEWLDAETQDGWVEHAELVDRAETLPVVISGGWLAHIDNETIRIVGGFSGDDADEREYINVQTIPRRMVRRIWRPTGAARYRGGSRG